MKLLSVNDVVSKLFWYSTFNEARTTLLMA